MKVWVTTGSFALLFAGAGLFLQSRDSLSDMDQVASVGSFLIALVSLAFGVVLQIRGQQAPAAARDSAAGIRIGSVNKVGQLNIGDNTTNYYRAGDELYASERSDDPQASVAPGDDSGSRAF